MKLSDSLNTRRYSYEQLQTTRDLKKDRGLVIIKKLNKVPSKEVKVISNLYDLLK